MINRQNPITLSLMHTHRLTRSAHLVRLGANSLLDLISPQLSHSLTYYTDPLGRRI